MGDCQIYSVIAYRYLRSYKPILYKYELTKGEGDYHYFLYFTVVDRIWVIDNYNYVYSYKEYAEKFGVKRKTKCTKKEIKEMIEYFEDPIACSIYLTQMNYKYKNYEDAINKTCESIDKKFEHIEYMNSLVVK